MNLNQIRWKRVLLFVVLPLVILAVVLGYCVRSCDHRGEPGYVSPDDTLGPA